MKPKNPKYSTALPEIISKTLDALWVLLLSVMGRVIMDMHLDLKSDLDYCAIARIVILTLCIILYGCFYFDFQKHYKYAEEKDKENQKKYLEDKGTERKRIPYYLWQSIHWSHFLLLLIPAGLFVLFLFMRSKF